MVVASIALLVALGGTGIAAVSTLAPKNTVGTQAVIDHSLLKQDFKAGQVPAGPAGRPGAPGSALAYAHVNRDGTLDEANSNNVAIVKTNVSSQAKPGTYCLAVTGKQAPKNAVATMGEVGVPGASSVGAISVQMTFTSVFCADDADAVVTTKIENGAFVPRPFFIVFN
jgi:hypothetical protein